MTAGSPVESVDRALEVLRTLAEAGAGGRTLGELSGTLGWHKTTLHRALGALRFRDFVTQDPTSGRYLLGPAAVALGESYYREENLPALLHPALVALCAATDELVHLGVLSGTQVVYLDKVEPERAVRVWSAVGRRNWAVTTALGRAMLAYRGTESAMLDGYVRAVGDSRPVDADRVRAEVEAAQHRGYAVENEENEPGIGCVAVPLVRAGVAFAALSVTVPVERLTGDRVARLHEQMVQIVPPLLPQGVSFPTAGGWGGHHDGRGRPV